MNITGAISKKDMNMSTERITNHTTALQEEKISSAVIDTVLPSNSRPQVSLFRAAIGGRPSPWHDFDTFPNHETLEDSMDSPKGISDKWSQRTHMDHKLNGRGGWHRGLGHETMEDGLAMGNRLEKERNSNTNVRDHDSNVEGGLDGEKEVLGQLNNPESVNNDWIMHENVDNDWVSLDIERDVVPNQRMVLDRLVIRGDEDEEFDTQPGLDDRVIQQESADYDTLIPSVEDDTPDNDYDLNALSTHAKKVNDGLKRGIKDANGYRDKDGSFDTETLVVDSPVLTEKVNKSLNGPKSYGYQRRVIKSNKTRPEIHSGAKYRPPSEKIWYEFVRGSHPLVSTWDDQARRRYRYNTRETSKIYPRTERNRFSTNERQSPKPYRRYFKHQNALENRPEKRKASVIHVKRWYD
ncbi:hypothetical protein EGW08_002738 [Elysia chlorotica]|uniref:Uncharacterized protein n=1 Tax=Elysia chlorotica TaxID=188477 RepID=A0A3S1BV32_ELYCH|nr:hypothetical protein EGW08_002738 [Elysia chlorotica]